MVLVPCIASILKTLSHTVHNMSKSTQNPKLIYVTHFAISHQNKFTYSNQNGKTSFPSLGVASISPRSEPLTFIYSRESLPIVLWVICFSSMESLT